MALFVWLPVKRRSISELEMPLIRAMKSGIAFEKLMIRLMDAFSMKASMAFYILKKQP